MKESISKAFEFHLYFSYFASFLHIIVIVVYSLKLFFPFDCYMTKKQAAAAFYSWTRARANERAGKLKHKQRGKQRVRQEFTKRIVSWMNGWMELQLANRLMTVQSMTDGVKQRSMVERVWRDVTCNQLVRLRAWQDLARQTSAFSAAFFPSFFRSLVPQVGR